MKRTTPSQDHDSPLISNYAARLALLSCTATEAVKLADNQSSRKDDLALADPESRPFAGTEKDGDLDVTHPKAKYYFT